MLALGQISWIILPLYIDIFLLQGCKAAIKSKEIWMQNDEGDHRFDLNPTRRLLDWEDNKPFPSWRKKDNYGDTTNPMVYIFVIIFLIILLAIIKCCKALNNEGNEEREEITVHAPPRQRDSSVRSYSSTSRPLAPPMSNSRSLILIPEATLDGRLGGTLFIGIENPNYSPLPNNVSNQEIRNSSPIPNNQQDLTPNIQINPTANIQFDFPTPNIDVNPTPLLDLPPDYNEVMRHDMQNAQSRTRNIPYVTQTNSEATYLPKYEDTHNMK